MILAEGGSGEPQCFLRYPAAVPINRANANSNAPYSTVCTTSLPG
ncbi:hypothetical protein Srot_0727 [Segniliparus rotundus DSM 44985]|uniref:Uncharacterized protein n=1 Tax=Segniliparus rotundus (strain ATCC BAA-972 / CDC 1076 / CIP 108378 / DSM 44985 / JCM 13578) TaxID=640132 RepID=D6ZDE3_SEGRD|nr:hypothetical protein Srot_0727 [Segniliparus rotundus DSM 44985]